MFRLIYDFLVALRGKNFNLKRTLAGNIPIFVLFFSNFSIISKFFKFIGLSSIVISLFIYLNFSTFSETVLFMVTKLITNIIKMNNQKKRNVIKYEKGLIIEMESGELILLKYDNKLVRQTINSEFYLVKDGKKVIFRPYPGIPIEISPGDICVDEIIQISEDGEKIFINTEQL